MYLSLYIHIHIYIYIYIYIYTHDSHWARPNGPPQEDDDNDASNNKQQQPDDDTHNRMFVSQDFCTCSARFYGSLAENRGDLRRICPCILHFYYLKYID